MKTFDYLLLIDTSLSMADFEEELYKYVIRHFRDILKPPKGRKVARKKVAHLGFFADDVSLIQPIVDIPELVKMLDSVIFSKGTNLSRAIRKGAEYLLATKSEKKLLVVLTDGHETDSEALDHLELMKEHPDFELKIILVGAGWNLDLPFEKYPVYGLITHQKNLVRMGDIFSMITGIYKTNSQF